jgi:RimJ/RimL family protein N-acetyltransferase
VTETVRIEPWGTDDLPLLQKALGDPAMMTYLGGPESPEKIAERQARYEQPGSRQYKIVVDDLGAGWVGYWERSWHGREVYEIGWSVIPAFQSRGVASVATAQTLALARAENDRRFVHAYPSVENAPSNAICRKLGFTLLGEHEFEWPVGSGSFMRCNDWRFDLYAEGNARG